jgi:hypothetical protein
MPYGAITANIGGTVDILVQVARRPDQRFVSDVPELREYAPERDSDGMPWETWR